MEEYRCFLVGRTSPDEGIEIAYDEVGDVKISTHSYTYTETEACISKELAEKIAKHYKKSVKDLTDDDVAEYLVEVMNIEDKIDGYDHYFSRDW